MAEFNPRKYEATIDAILRTVNLDEISAKRMRNGIEGIFGVDLSRQKEAMDKVIMDRYLKIQAEQEKSRNGRSNGGNSGGGRGRNGGHKYENNNRNEEFGDDVDDDDDDEEEDDVDGQPMSQEEADALLAAQLQSSFNKRELRTERKTQSKVAKSRKKTSSSSVGSAPSSAKKRAAVANNPFNKPLILSPSLADLVGTSELSRPQVVKKLWEYIHNNNLQNPSNKREIISDAAFSKVFGSRIDCFQMNRVLKNHLAKPEELANRPVDPPAAVGRAAGYEDAPSLPLEQQPQADRFGQAMDMDMGADMNMQDHNQSYSHTPVPYTGTGNQPQVDGASFKVASSEESEEE